MKLSDEMILKIVDTFDETSKLYYNVSINEEKDNTSVTNYNIYVNRTNYYECLLKMIDYYLGKIELNIDEEIQNKQTLIQSLEQQITQLQNEMEQMKNKESTNINELKLIKEAVIKINPDRLQLNSLDRPSAGNNVAIATRKRLEELKEYFDDSGVFTEIISRIPQDCKTTESEIIKMLNNGATAIEDIRGKFK